MLLDTFSQITGSLLTHTIVHNSIGLVTSVSRAILGKGDPLKNTKHVP